MGNYNTQYNYDDVITRNIIIGLISDLNDKLYFYRNVNGERRKVNISFFFSLSSSQNFLFDHFMYSNGDLTHYTCDKNCDTTQIAFGHYDVTPKAIISIDGLSVETAALTNKHIRGYYGKIDSDGIIREHTAIVHLIPTIFNFKIDIITDNITENLKITESIIKRLYSQNEFSIETRDMDEAIFRLDAKYAIPEEYGNEFQYEYGFDDKEDPKISFNIEVKSFIPSINYGTELSSQTIMKNLYGNLSGFSIPNTEFPTTKRMETIYGNIGLDSDFKYPGTSSIDSIFRSTGLNPISKDGKVIIQNFFEKDLSNSENI